MKYVSLEDYIVKNINGMHGEFTVVVTDCSEKSPNTLLVSISSTYYKDAELAEFYIRANGKIESKDTI